MNRSKRYFALIVTGLMFTLNSCHKNTSSGPEPLDFSYSGTLSYIFLRDFPAISDTLRMSVSIQKDRTVIFSGGGSNAFDQEQISYENGQPVTRIHMSGTMNLMEAKGAWYTYQEAEYLLALIHSKVEGQMTVWEYDSLAGWRMIQEGPFVHEDTYDEGETQFSISDALSGGAIMATSMPDDQGESTVEYLVRLTAASR
jgi:uncharacterized membrane protein YkvI